MQAEETSTAGPGTPSWQRRLWQELIGPDTWFVLLHFFLSRVVILLGGAMTAMLLASEGRQQLMPLFELDEVQKGIRLLFVAGDANWYMRIVENGYEAIPFSAERTHNWAFFPLFPLLVTLLGGTVDAGVLVASVVALIAVRILMHEVRDIESATAARWTVLFIWYWPFSVMLSAVRPESLVLLGAVLAWTFARRGHWWLAWTGVAIATMSRSQGLFTALLLIDPIWAQRHVLLRRPWPLILGAALPLLALGAFSLHLWDLTGDPLAWSHIQAAWGRTGIDLNHLRRIYWPPLYVSQWDFAFFSMATILLVGFAALLMVHARRIGFAIFSVVWLAFPTVYGSTLIGLGRYATALFPVAITLASARILRRFRLSILIVMVGLQFGVAAWLSMDIVAVAP